MDSILRRNYLTDETSVDASNMLNSFTADAMSHILSTDCGEQIMGEENNLRS